MRTNTMQLCRHVQNVTAVPIWLVRTRKSAWTQTRFFYPGTERTTMDSLDLLRLDPFRSVPQGRIGQRVVSRTRKFASSSKEAFRKQENPHSRIVGTAAAKINIRAGSSINPQISSATNAACISNSNVTYLISC